jgi:hypothetical protein
LYCCQPFRTPHPPAPYALLAPRAAEELIAFVLDNGVVRISLLSHAAVAAGSLDEPSTGILWEDLQRFFQEERLLALGVSAQAVPVPGVGSSDVLTGAVEAPPPVEVAPVEPTPTTAPTASAPGAVPEGLSSLLLPVCGGIAIVVVALVALVIVVRRRKRQGGRP